MNNCHIVAHRHIYIDYNRYITNKQQIMTPDQLFNFYDYVYSFYGKDGIYPENDRTIPQIAEATAEYLEICFNSDSHMTWGDGDSLDRERVRDIMNKNLGDVNNPIGQKYTTIN